MLFEKEIDDALAQVQSMDDLRSIAPQVEVFLGEAERAQDDVTVEELDEAWAYFCDEALEKAKDFELPALSADKPDALRDGLLDNYFHYAVACVLAGDTFKDQPVIAWAAFNKNQYSGWKDEICVVRLLLAAGFNPNLPYGKNTALHFMSASNVGQLSLPRGVRLLLESGASPHAKNHNGDTPFCYLAGSMGFTQSSLTSAIFLTLYGSDPLSESNDGETPWSLFKKAEAKNPQEDRAWFMDHLRKENPELA